MKPSKKQILYRLGSLALALLLAIQLVPLPIAHAADTELEATIEEQIRAYADSIDQKNADDKAAAALAGRGISGGGKTFSVGERHALTATLFNSELLQAALRDSLAEAIRTMQDMGQSTLDHVFGYVEWSDDYNGYHLYVYKSASDNREELDRTLCDETPASLETMNDYDTNLTWIVGGVQVWATVQRSSVDATTATYTVECTIKDRFDFATSNNGGFKDHIFGFAAMMFEEFDWTASVTFELTVPYDCTHSSSAYHWIYDCSGGTMIADSEDGFTKNPAVYLRYENEYGSRFNYYALEHPVRLYHNKPWVIEYTVRDYYQISLEAFEDSNSATIPALVQAANQENRLSFLNMNGTNTWGISFDYYGLKLCEWFPYSASVTYRIKLENQYYGSGENRTYLTVSDAETGETLINREPMNNHYHSYDDEETFVSDDTTWMNGKDLYINFIGNRRRTFSAKSFELWIWENGEGNPGEKLGVLQSTENGVNTYLCPLCGGTYKESAYIPGDINGDGSVNNKDATRLFQHLSGWDVEVVETALDVNGDGSVNNKDATRLFQYLSGWDVAIC